MDDKAKERDKYIALWALEAYRSDSPGERYIGEAVKFFESGASVIDFGCGCGRATEKLAQLGYRVLAVDFAGNCLDPGIRIPLLVADLTEIPVLSADYGFCCDVMEHIPTHYVDDVLSGIAQSVKRGCFFSIAMHMDAAGRLIGERLHLTVQPAPWWQEKLLQHFSVVTLDDRGANLICYADRQQSR